MHEFEKKKSAFYNTFSKFLFLIATTIQLYFNCNEGNKLIPQLPNSSISDVPLEKN